MHIRVKLYATFRLEYKKDYDVEKGLLLDLSRGSTIHDALQILEIKPGSVSLLRINGVIIKDFHTTLSDNDTLDIFPFVGGG